jgi:hypothetical protein
VCCSECCNVVKIRPFQAQCMCSPYNDTAMWLWGWGEWVYPGANVLPLENEGSHDNMQLQGPPVSPRKEGRQCPEIHSEDTNN